MDVFSYSDLKPIKTTEETYERYVNRFPVRLLMSQHLILFIPEDINEKCGDVQRMEWVNEAERIGHDNNGVIPDRIILGNGSQKFDCIIRLRKL